MDNHVTMVCEEETNVEMTAESKKIHENFQN